MPKLSNARHEAFAQYLSEGLTADEAYEKAGYKANRGNASNLKANQNILDRVQEIQERRQKLGDVTVDSITKMLIADRKLARTEKQSGAAVSATMGIAKLHGLITDKVKSEHVMKHDPDDFEDSELAAIASAGRANTSEQEECAPDPSRLH